MALKLKSASPPVVQEAPTKKESKGENLAQIIAAFRKDKGEKVIVQGNQIQVVRRLPTGIFEFDFYIGGGFPCGRYSIIYGPESSNKTNLCLKAVASAQKLPSACNKAVWVNIEQSFDPVWAEKMGVDTSKLMIVEAGYGEEAIDIVDALVRAEDLAILVVDSMAGLIASKEIANSVEKYDIGTSALLIKRMVNKLMIAFCEERKRDHDPCVILINQTRFKPGVLFGDPECLHGETLVNFVDGRSIPIRTVVEEKLMGQVWSYDEASAQFVPTEIVSHHYNGKAQPGELYTVTSEAVDTKNGVLSATVSRTHRFLTKFSGWKTAENLQVHNQLLTKRRSVINGTLRQFLLGTGCGDLTLAVTNATGKSRKACLKIEDSENPAYVDWKAGLLAKFFTLTKRPNDSGQWQYVSEPRSDLFALKEELPARHPKALFEDFSWLAFAVWMMDDGNWNAKHKRYTLSIGRFRELTPDREYISAQLEALGLAHTWTRSRKNVVFTVAASYEIAERIMPYVPPPMHYKLPQGMGRDGLCCLNAVEELIPYWVPITKIEQASPRKYRDPRYFDIHVAGPNNYLVGNLDNGFVVHNTMPGGEAQKFLSSLRVRVRATNEIDKATSTLVFKKTHATIKKAKVPVRAADFDFDFCVHDHDDLKVGETDSFNMVKSHLQALGLLTKETKGYKLTAPSSKSAGKAVMMFTTLTAIRDEYQKDQKFRAQLQKLVIDSHKDHLLLVEEADYSPSTVPTGDVTPVQSSAYIDKTTGEEIT